MTERIPVTGFDRKRYAGCPILEIPLSVIDDNHKPSRSPKRVKQYAKMFKEGKVAPPIEVIEMPGLKVPYDIYNGIHRYRAAVLAGRKTVLAVMAKLEFPMLEYVPFDLDEYADEWTESEALKIKTVGFVGCSNPSILLGV
jgi:hypothetical protein